MQRDAIHNGMLACQHEHRLIGFLIQLQQYGKRQVIACHFSPAKIAISTQPRAPLFFLRAKRQTRQMPGLLCS